MIDAETKVSAVPVTTVYDCGLEGIADQYSGDEPMIATAPLECAGAM